MNKTLTAAVIFAASLIIFLAGLECVEFTRINGRFALFIGEMNLYGAGIFPTLYNKPYTDYPSLHTWLMYLCSGSGSYINMVTATLPSALSGAVILVFTYLIGARISQRLGIYAVLLCLLSYEFISICRAPSMDLIVGALMIIIFYLIYTADADRGYRRLWWILPALILGFAIRGPLGLVTPTAVICGYYLINRQWLKFIISGGAAGLLLIACMAGWFWLCYLQGGKELLELFLNDQIASRFEKIKPPWYFLTNAMASYAIVYPLGLLAVAVYCKKVFKAPNASDSRELALMRALTGWILIVIIGLSIPGTKHLRYIVGIIPALALAAAWIWINFDKIRIFEQIKKMLELPLRLLPWVALAALVIAEIVMLIGKFDIGLPFVIPLLIFASLCWCSRRFYRQADAAEQKDFAALLLAALTMATIFIMIIPRIEQKLESSSEFVAATEQVRGDGKICFFNFGPDGDDLKYIINLPLSKRFVGEYLKVDFYQEKTKSKAVEKQKPDSLERLASVSSKAEEKQKSGSLERLVAALSQAILDSLPPNSKQFPPIRPRFIILTGEAALAAMPANTVFITREKQFKNMPESVISQFTVIATGKMGHQKCIAFKKKPL